MKRHKVAKEYLGKDAEKKEKKKKNVDVSNNDR